MLHEIVEYSTRVIYLSAQGEIRYYTTRELHVITTHKRSTAMFKNEIKTEDPE